MHVIKEKTRAEYSSFVPLKRRCSTNLLAMERKLDDVISDIEQVNGRPRAPPTPRHSGMPTSARFKPRHRRHLKAKTFP